MHYVVANKVACILSMQPSIFKWTVHVFACAHRPECSFSCFVSYLLSRNNGNNFLDIKTTRNHFQTRTFQRNVKRVPNWNGIKGKRMECEPKKKTNPRKRETGKISRIISMWNHSMGYFSLKMNFNGSNPDDSEISRTHTKTKTKLQFTANQIIVLICLVFNNHALFIQSIISETTQCIVLGANHRKKCCDTSTHTNPAVSNWAQFFHHTHRIDSICTQSI